MVLLAEMRTEVRRMTGRYTPAQMPDSQIDLFINRAYTLHMPMDFKTLKLIKPYVFLTTPNVDTYDFVYESGIAKNPNKSPIPGNVQITPPVYCQGYVVSYFQDKGIFYNRWPRLSVNQQINSGNGTAGPYTGTIPSTPFLRAQLDIFGVVTEAAVIISAQNNTGFSYSLTDIPQQGSNTGNLVDALGVVVGTVNYLTGVYTFTVNIGVIPSGTVINAAVNPYQGSRPTDVLFANQQIIFRPVPKDIYQVEFQISQQPTALIAAGQAPELDEWYLYLCSWAAKLIYTAFPDPEGMAYLMPIWQEQMQQAQRRTLKQLGTQRIATVFSIRRRPYGSYFLGNEYSGGSA